MSVVLLSHSIFFYKASKQQTESTCWMFQLTSKQCWIYVHCALFKFVGYRKNNNQNYWPVSQYHVLGQGNHYFRCVCCWKMPMAQLHNLTKAESIQLVRQLGEELPGLDDLDLLHKPSNEKWKETEYFMPIKLLQGKEATVMVQEVNLVSNEPIHTVTLCVTGQ